MDELQKLYDALSSRGYYTKSFDEFKVQFQDPAYQEKVFGVVSRDGLYTKTKEDFTAKYVAPVAKPKAAAVAPVPGVRPIEPKPAEVKATPLPSFVEKQMKGISPNLMAQTEEFVVPKLNYELGPLGFKFEETGPGDFMKVTAPNGKSRTISLDGFTKKDDEFASAELQKFIRENSPASKLQTLEKEYTQANQKFATQKEVDESIAKYNQEENDFRAKTQQILKKANELKAEKAEVEKNLSDIERVNQYNAKAAAFEQELASMTELEKSIEERSKNLNTAIGKYSAMKAEQGTWLGGIWNKMLTGASRVSATAANMMTDLMVELAPKGLLMGKEEYRKAVIEKAKARGIKAPAESLGLMKSEDQYNTWYNSLDSKTRSAIDDEIEDEAKKEIKYGKKDVAGKRKEGMLEAIRMGNRTVAGDPNTTPEWEQLKSEGFWGGAILGLAESVPAMIGSSNAVGWAQRTAQMYGQVADNVYEEMSKNPEFDNIPESEKALVTAPIGIAVGALESIGLRNVIANKGLLNGIVLRALGKAGATTTAKSFGELVKNEVKSGLARGTLTLIGGALAEAETGAAQEAVEVGIKEIYNAAKDKDMFKTPESFSEFVKDVAVAGAQEAVGGLIIGTLPAAAAAYRKQGFLGMSDEQFGLFEAAANDIKIEQAYVGSLKNKVNLGEMTMQEAKDNLNDYRNAVGLFNSLPSNLNMKGKKEAMNLLREKRELERQIDGKDEALTVPQRERIKAINEELTKISQNAVQEQSTNESVLRTEQPEVGLQQVGEGDQKSQVVTQGAQEQAQGGAQEVVSLKTQPDTETVVSALEANKKANPFKISNTGRISGGNIELRVAAQDADKKPTIKEPTKVEFLPDTISLVHLARNEKDANDILKNGFDVQQVDIDSPVPGVYFSSEDWSTMDRFGRKKEDALLTEISNDGLVYFDNVSDFKFFLEENNLPSEGQTLSNQQVQVLKDKGIKGIVLREDFASQSRNEFIVVDPSIIKSVKKYAGEDITPLPPSFSDSKAIAEAYQKNKQAGTNPEFVQAVEKVIYENTQTQRDEAATGTIQPGATEAEPTGLGGPTQAAPKREQVKSSLQRIARAGLIRSAEGDKPITEQEIDAQMALTDAMARVWEKTTGKNDFYEVFFDDVSEGNLEALKEKGGALFQDVEDPKRPISRVTLAVFNEPQFKAMQGKMVAPQSISDLMKSRGKQIEKDIIAFVLGLDKYQGQKRIPFDEFRNDVEIQLMKLEPIVTSSYSDYGMDNLGDDHNYGAHETIIFNSPVDHGDYGHFRGAFHRSGIDAPIEWEVRQLPNSEQFVAIDKNMPPNVSQAELSQYVGTAGSREQVEAWVSKRSDGGGGFLNIGLFGHIRNWFNRATGVYALAELQSDYFQKNKATDLYDAEISRDEVDEYMNKNFNAPHDQKYAEIFKNEFGIGEVRIIQGENGETSFGAFEKDNPDGFIYAITRSSSYEAPPGREMNELNTAVAIAESARRLATGKFKDTPLYDRFFELKNQYEKERQDFRLKQEQEYIAKRREEIRNSNKGNLILDQFIASQKNHEMRIFREALKHAADKGATELWFPSPYTIALIEGYISDKGRAPYDVISGNEDYLTEGDIIDYGGTEMIVVESDNSTITVAPRDEVSVYDYDDLVVGEVDNRMDELLYDFKQQVEIIRAVTKEEADNYTENEWMSDEVRKALDEYFEENPEEETVSWYDIEDKVRDAVEDRYRDMNDEDLVGWASAIYRVNDTLYVLENRRQIETLDQPGEYAGEAQEETFEDDLSSEQRTVVNKYKDLAKMIRKMRPDVVEVTDDNGKTWLKTEVTEADKSNPIIAFQEEGGKAKGAIDFANDNKASVYIFDGADISTLAHEMSGHLGRRVLERLAKVDEKFAKDYETAKKWAGVEDNQWTRAAEEKWARAFEKYLATGKAPSKALTNVFEKLKTWLTNIYNTIKGSSIDIELTPEIVKVFDNLLATESEQLMTADTKDATVLEKVLDFLDKAEADLDRFSAETAGINLAVPVIKAIIKTVKALVKTGITLQEAISRAAAQNNVSESDVVDAMNYLFNQREVEAKPEGVSEMELPGYNRMMDELQGVIDRSIERGNTEEVAMQNAISYLQGSRVYESASDTQREKMVRDVRKMFGKRERPAPKPEKLFGEVKDVKQITMSEYNLLKKQLADTARGAKNAISLWRRTGAALADYLKKMQDGGHITAKQAGVILKKFSGVNLFKQESIDKFVDYMAKVFDNAAYAEKISNIRAMLPTAKKNVQTKLGVAQSLVPLMTKLFAINPTLIPDAVFEKYAALVEMMGQRKAVLQLSEYGQVLDAVEEVLNAVDEEVSRSEELAELFNAYPDKLVDEDGKIDFAGTITSMIKDGVIDEEDAKLMRKYKKNIVPMVQKEAKSEEQLQQEKEALIKIIRDTEVDSDGLPMKDERNLARELARLIKTDGINGLDNTQLGNLLRVIDNINNGYLPHFAQLMVERLTAINNGTNLEKAVAEAKPLKLSTVYSKLKSLLTGKDKFTELIRRNPLYYIDQVFGNFNTRDIYDAVFEKAAEGQAMFKRAVTELTNKLDAAEEAVAKSFKFDSNKLTMSKFKMMTFMVQLENDSNPDSDKVNSAAKYLKKTIEHIKNGKTSFGERDAEMLQQILDDYSNSEGEIDNEKLYNSFNEAEKKAIKTVQEINEAIRDKAVYTASVIRGDSIHPLNNYIHLNVLHEYRPEEAVSGVAFVDAYNNSLRPSTKAKSLITRTGKVSPLNFDLFASANRGAKFVLMDYYLTEPIRTARKTINEASAILKEDEVDNKQKRDILNAIDRAFEEATENLLTSNFTSSSFGDKVVEFVSKQGYRAVLASLPRFAAELSSNIAFVMIAAPKDFKLGVKYRDLVLSADAPNVMANVGSKQVNRIFPHDTLSGRLVDTSILNQASGVKGSRAKNDVANKIQQIYNLSLKKYQNVVEVMADALIATPDKMVMRPMWFGAFANEFKRMSGKDVDFDKIAANDEIYMAENKEAIDAARIIADQKTVLTGAADNAFMGVLKGTPKPNQKPLLRAFNMFNNFMTNFLVYEYMTARTGIMAAMGNGSISRKQGVALLGAVATRMTLYTLMTNILTNGLIGLFVDDEDEDDEKTFIQKVGQAIASSVTSMMLGRDFGNATKAVINQGVEYANQEFLDFLRAGEYDPYKDAIQYTVLPPERKGKKAAFSDMLMNMMGPFGPSAKTAEFAYRKATEEPKKKQDAIERSEAERDIRLPLEVLGNLGMIPLYKDVRRIVMKQLYQDIEKAENKSGEPMMKESDMKRYYPDLWEDMYGPGTPGYDERELKKEMQKEKRRVTRQMKDEMYDYVPKKKERVKKKKEDFGKGAFGETKKKKKESFGSGKFGASK